MKYMGLVVAVVVGGVVGWCGAGEGPRLSAASLMCPNGEAFLIYGEGLNGAGVKVHVADLKPGEGWEAVGSLRRVLEGKVSLPEKPVAGAMAVGVHAADERTAVVKGYSGEWKAPAKVVWVEGVAGISNPLAINVPEVWTITPARPMVGERVRFFGVNFDGRGAVSVCLVGEDGRVIPCAWGKSYSGEKGISPAFERTFVLPRDVRPGRYRLFVNCGGGDHGWSRGFELEVVAGQGAGRVYRCDEAPGDGESEASEAIQKAIDQAAGNGGGVVALKAGVFVVKKTIRVKEGVTLRGAGKAATVLVSPREGQIPKGFHHYRPVVELGNRSALEHVTVDATEGEDHHGVLIRSASDAALRHCEVRNLRGAYRAKGEWVADDNVVTATQHTYRLVVEDNVLRGNCPFSHWGGEMNALYFAHNVCEGLPTQGTNVSFRGLRGSVVEHNRISRGGRGLVVAGEAVHNYFGFNIIENIRGAGNGCEMFLYEMGGAPWQGRPGQVTENSFVTAGKAWDEKALRSTADSFIFTTYAMVTEGRGMGQCVPVAAVEGERVKLARPWTVRPDESSSVVVFYGCVENIHVENQFKEGLAFSGVFGAAARNVWAGDEFERVSDGMVLWGLGREYPVGLNVLRDLRMQDRAGILLIAGLETNKPLTQVEMLGNEIRSCQVYGRARYPGNEYGLGSRVWRWGFNGMKPGNARHVTFGSEAGIHLSAFYDWPGNHTDEDAKLEGSVSPMRWTLIWDSLVARSPVGVRIGRGIERTVMVDVASELNGKEVSDSGKGTVVD